MTDAGRKFLEDVISAEFLRLRKGRRAYRRDLWWQIPSYLLVTIATISVPLLGAAPAWWGYLVTMLAWPPVFFIQGKRLADLQSRAQKIAELEYQLHLTYGSERLTRYPTVTP